MKYCDSCRSSYPSDFTTCPRDSGALRDLAELTPGMMLRGKYEVLSRLGAGGMGAVYKVRHVVFGETRALKVLSGQIAGDPAYLARFRTEAAVARRLDHRGAVRVDDFDTTDDGHPYIVMELVEGESLRALLHREGALPLPRAVDLARQACAALHAAHGLGIIHRDIKPENMVLLPGPGGDLLKILDFGLAKVRPGHDGSDGQVATGTGILIGTPEYMSPEQALGSRGSEMDGRVDVYALGVVLYEMVTGQRPFAADSPMAAIFAHVSQEPPPPEDLRRDLPPELSAVIAKALAKDRARRFPTAEAFGEALAAVPLGPGPVAPTPVVAAPPPPPAPLPTPVAAPTVAAPRAAAVPTVAVPPRPEPPPPPPAPVVPAGRAMGPWVLVAGGAVALVAVAAVLLTSGSGAKPAPEPAQAGTPTPAPAPAQAGTPTPVTAPAATTAPAMAWDTYDEPEYGFSMLVPRSAKVAEEETGDWGRLSVRHQGVELLAFAKLGPAAEEEEIVAFTLQAVGVPEERWTEVDARGGRGWTWQTTVRAADQGKVLFGGYGAGPRGSYVVLLKTTEDDFRAHEADYLAWYRSVTLR